MDEWTDIIASRSRETPRLQSEVSIVDEANRRCESPAGGWIVAGSESRRVALGPEGQLDGVNACEFVHDWGV